MADRPSRIEIAVYSASADGLYHGRYPNGGAPLVNQALSGSSSMIDTVTGTLGGSINAYFAYLESLMGVTGEKLSGQHLDYFAASGGGTYGDVFDQFLPATGATPSNITINDRASGNTGLCPAIISYQLNTGNVNGAGTFAQSLAACQGVQAAGNILQLGYPPYSPVTAGKYGGPNGEFPNVITPGTGIYNTFMAGVAAYGAAMAQLSKPFILRPFHESNGGIGSYWWAYGSGTGGGAPSLAQFLQLWNQTMAGLQAAMDAAVPGSWDALVILNWNQNYGNNYNNSFGGASANYLGPGNIAVPSGTYAPDVCSLDYYFWDDVGSLPLNGSGYNQMISLGLPFFLAETGFSGGTPPAVGTKDLSACSTALATSTFQNCFGFAYWAQTFALNQQNNALACLQGSITRSQLPARHMTPGTPVTTVSLPSASSIAATVTLLAGDCVAVFATCDSTGGTQYSSVSDGTNAYAARGNVNDTTNNQRMQTFWFGPYANAQNITVTATLSAAANDLALLVLPIHGASGIRDSSSAWQVAPTTGTNAVLTVTGSGSPIIGDFAIALSLSDADFSSTAAGTGFTDLSSWWTALSFARLESFMVAANGNFTSEFTASVNSSRLTQQLIFAPASLAGAAVNTCVATGSMVIASVTLASPLYTGVGGILDPNFWFDSKPVVGSMMFYDSTHIVILPNGEINSNSNNCSAAVQFVDGNGNLATGLVVFPGTMVGYAVSAATPAGILHTLSVPTYTLDSTFIINILPRIFTVSGPAVQRFDVKDPAESVNLAFNFTLGLTGGITLQGTPSVTVTVSSGVDPNPNALMSGPPGLDATKSYVIQPVTGGLNGVEYEWVASCQTRDPNTVLAVAGILPVKR